MKKILAIMGSPRKNKNTNIALDYLLEGIDEDKFLIEKIYLRDLTINHCTGCDYCGKQPNCTINDDMNKLYNGFDTSDIIILAAPLYFNSLNGLTKNMIDRCQRYWSLKYSLKEKYKNTEDRIGIFLSVGGAKFSYNQFSGTLPVMDFFFKSVNAYYKGNYFISNTDNISVEDRKEVKEELNNIGKEILIKKDFYLQR